jgi:hypothetical protein
MNKSSAVSLPLVSVVKQQSKPSKADGGASKAKALFSAYQVTENAVQAARKALDDAMAARSVAVAEISAAIGNGPFQFSGAVQKIQKRDVKAEDGSLLRTTWFFKSIGDNVVSIDL